ncbi:LytTR family DNA-binding domain-containing protein [Caulobacter sp. 17J65-9]|uniref:LytTR family DNA-binding domain-containing protein n=1 Tax=Caulobacter sp. 17J65-9 TaxID=2709382 RepID=UPI0013CB1EDB|nr:LytTR family DNA-binding domain-containing protein [Caulobacter sp. 17J65-9]NEX92706.1 LytTR family transcriptional regulator [Caulobacter sp. 17J65-9]
MRRTSAAPNDTPKRSPAEWLRGVGIAAAAGLFMGLAGAFGSDAAPLPLRLAYWVGMMVVGGVWGHVAAGFVQRRGWFGDRVWLQAALMIAVMTPPLTVSVWLATAWTFGAPLQLAALPWFFPPVLMVAAVMTGVNLLAGRTHAGPAPAPEQPAEPPRFLERLPLKLRGAELYAVESEDHYLRLHTERGSDLILMRLSDAVAELEGIEGAQTHRSWWVAKAAVADVRRGDGKAQLTLKNGVEVPVSRTHARALRAAGWY